MGIRELAERGMGGLKLDEKMEASSSYAMVIDSKSKGHVDLKERDNKELKVKHNVWHTKVFSGASSTDIKDLIGYWQALLDLATETPSEIVFSTDSLSKLRVGESAPPTETPSLSTKESTEATAVIRPLIKEIATLMGEEMEAERIVVEDSILTANQFFIMYTGQEAFYMSDLEARIVAAYHKFSYKYPLPLVFTEDAKNHEIHEDFIKKKHVAVTNEVDQLRWKHNIPTDKIGVKAEKSNLIQYIQTLNQMAKEVYAMPSEIVYASPTTISLSARRRHR